MQKLETNLSQSYPNITNIRRKKINKTIIILYNSQYIERSYNITMNKYKVEEILTKH